MQAHDSSISGRRIPVKCALAVRIPENVGMVVDQQKNAGQKLGIKQFSPHNRPMRQIGNEVKVNADSTPAGMPCGWLAFTNALARHWLRRRPRVSGSTSGVDSIADIGGSKCQRRQWPTSTHCGWFFERQLSGALLTFISLF
jgi:hypothetical protein